MTVEEARNLLNNSKPKGNNAYSIMLNEALDMVIKSSEQESRWIPVSERLPEESLNSVIGWDAYRERCVFVQYIDGYFQITGSAESFDIVAWMPLPKPYEPQERSDKE